MGGSAKVVVRRITETFDIDGERSEDVALRGIPGEECAFLRLLARIERDLDRLRRRILEKATGDHAFAIGVVGGHLDVGGRRFACDREEPTRRVHRESHPIVIGMATFVRVRHDARRTNLSHERGEGSRDLDEPGAHLQVDEGKEVAPRGGHSGERKHLISLFESSLRVCLRIPIPRMPSERRILRRAVRHVNDVAVPERR